jgi:flagellar hook-basal body complex protein FliE
MTLPSFNAARVYAAAQSLLKSPGQGGPSASAPTPAGAAFDAVRRLAAAVSEGERTAAAYMAGGADPHSVVEALAAAELAVETAVVIRDKVVEAYQELLRMPV